MLEKRQEQNLDEHSDLNQHLIVLIVRFQSTLLQVRLLITTLLSIVSFVDM